MFEFLESTTVTSASRYVCSEEGIRQDVKETGPWSNFNVCFCRVSGGCISVGKRGHSVSILCDLWSPCHRALKGQRVPAGAAVTLRLSVTFHQWDEHQEPFSVKVRVCHD